MYRMVGRRRRVCDVGKLGGSDSAWVGIELRGLPWNWPLWWLSKVWFVANGDPKLRQGFSKRMRAKSKCFRNITKNHIFLHSLAFTAYSHCLPGFPYILPVSDPVLLGKAVFFVTRTETVEPLPHYFTNYFPNVLYWAVRLAQVPPFSDFHGSTSDPESMITIISSKNTRIWRPTLRSPGYHILALTIRHHIWILSISWRCVTMKPGRYFNMFDHALCKLPTTSFFPREELPPHMQAEPLGFEARQINAECRQKRSGRRRPFQRFAACWWQNTWGAQDETPGLLWGPFIWDRVLTYFRIKVL